MHSTNLQGNGRISIERGDAESRALASKVMADLAANESQREFTWDLVKKNNLRTVFRVTTPNAIVFAKLHHVTGIGQRFKNWLLGTPANREFDASQFATKHGVPCVNVFATALSRSPGATTSIALSHAVESSRSLADEFAELQDAGTPAACRQLSESVAQLLATAHNAGFLHADDHPGNILVQRVAEGQVKCLYVDLYGSRYGREVLPADSAYSLASLGQWFVDRASRTERLRVVKKYIQLRGWPTTGAFLRTFVEQIKAASTRRKRILYRKRDKRITRNNSHFKQVALSDDWHSWITLRFRHQPELTGAQPPDWPATDVAEFVRERFGLGSDDKQNNSISSGLDDSIRFTSNMREAWSWRWFGSPARRRYVLACEAMNRDIPTALPIGIAEQRSALGTRCAKDITGRPPQCAPIQTLLSELPCESRRALLERIGRLLAQTFERGIVISNLSPTRIEAACFNGLDVPIWVGIEGRSTMGQLSNPTRSWMLAKLAIEAGCTGMGDAIQMARVLRACVRSTSSVSDWKLTWREVRETANLMAGSVES